MMTKKLNLSTFVGIICLAVIFGLITPTYSNAQPLDGLSAIQQKAESGNASAQYALGMRYVNGQSVAQNFSTAATWLQKAAVQGHAEATTTLGLIYYFGLLSGKQDLPRALELFTTGSEMGDSRASFTLGMMYLNGEGVARDPHYAVRLLEKAAAGGSHEAQYNLGVIYEEGYDVKQSLVKSVQYYMKAAAGGNVQAMVNLGFMYEKGRGVTRNKYTAAEYFETAAVNYDPIAMLKMAEYCYNGSEVEYNPTAAYIYIALAMQHVSVKNSHQVYADAETLRQKIAAEMTPEELKVAEANIARETPQNLNEKKRF